MITSTAGVSIHSFTRARIASTSSRTLARSNTMWPGALMRSDSVAPDLSSAISRVSAIVRTASSSGPTGLLCWMPAMPQHYSIRAGYTPAGRRQSTRIIPGSCPTPEHIAEIVIDRVQELRRRIHRSELDDKAVADHPVAERPFRRVRAIPREVDRLAVALAYARLLGTRERR